MKWLSSDSLSSDCSTVKQRKVSLAIHQKWKTEMDQECNALSWLDCETSGAGAKKTVKKLKCKVCIQSEGRRNYSDKWVSGADSIWTSTVCEVEFVVEAYANLQHGRNGGDYCP